MLSLYSTFLYDHFCVGMCVHMDVFEYTHTHIIPHLDFVDQSRSNYTNEEKCTVFCLNVLICFLVLWNIAQFWCIT